MTWGNDLNGGPQHRGLCPECGKDTYTCYDELCDDCIDASLEEVSDEDAESFAAKFISKAQLMELFDEVQSDIKTNCKPQLITN